MNDDLNGEADMLRRDARRFLRQLVSGEATTTDADTLRRWRRQSPAHETAFVEAVKMWKGLESGGRAFIELHGPPAWPGYHPAMTRRAMIGGAGALAASVAGYGLVNPPLHLWPSFEELRADYRTATGEQKRFAIADIAVQMNTQTCIAIAGGAGDARSVRLIAGEASFTMPPQASQPLIVVSGDGRAVASHARFDVRNTAGTTCVTCIEGELLVELGAQSAPVGAGQQLTYDQSSLHPAVLVDSRQVTSWQDGFIVFRSTRLADAVAEINRYRPGRVVVVNRALAQKNISGRFRIARTDEILGWIEQATGARARALPGGIVLLS